VPIRSRISFRLDFFKAELFNTDLEIASLSPIELSVPMNSLMSENKDVEYLQMWSFIWMISVLSTSNASFLRCSSLVCLIRFERGGNITFRYHLVSFPSLFKNIQKRLKHSLMNISQCLIFKNQPQLFKRNTCIIKSSFLQPINFLRFHQSPLTKIFNSAFI
jgi:hypothetical protein